MFSGHLTSLKEMFIGVIRGLKVVHTSCEDALKEKKISEQTTGLALFWTYFCIRICVETNDLATSKQGLVYITI